MAALFLAKSAQPLRHRRVAWLTAFQPITVAGPRPNFTAFPAAHACKLKIECMPRSKSCQRQPTNGAQTAVAQRFFQFGFRFSTIAFSPSCESSRRYSSFRKIFMECFNPSFSDIPMPPRIARLAIVSTGPEWLVIRMIRSETAACSCISGTTRLISPNSSARSAVTGSPVSTSSSVILLVLSFIFKQDFLSMFSGTDQSSAPVATDSKRDAAEEPMVQFVSFVLDDAQRTWDQILPSVGKDYHDAKLVLFRDAVQSGCGTAESATGPFYCPRDERVYIDLSFFDELKRKFGAPGDFAQPT